MYSALTDQSGDSISSQPMTKFVLSISLANTNVTKSDQSQIGIIETQIRPHYHEIKLLLLLILKFVSILITKL